MIFSSLTSLTCLKEKKNLLHVSLTGTRNDECRIDERFNLKIVSISGAQDCQFSSDDNTYRLGLSRVTRSIHRTFADWQFSLRYGTMSPKQKLDKYGIEDETSASRSIYAIFLSRHDDCFQCTVPFIPLGVHLCPILTRRVPTRD